MEPLEVSDFFKSAFILDQLLKLDHISGLAVLSSIIFNQVALIPPQAITILSRVRNLIRQDILHHQLVIIRLQPRPRPLRRPDFIGLAQGAARIVADLL